MSAVDEGIARMTMLANTIEINSLPDLARAETAMLAEERSRARCYPLSRWYLRPLAGCMARALASTAVRPWHLTLLGLFVAILAAAILLAVPKHAAWCSLLVMLYWFFDRADGQLARWQQKVTAWGAWLDANVDELVDLGLHTAVAHAAAGQIGASWPWFAFGAFLFGKYLLMYGMFVDVAPDGNDAGHPTSNAASSWLRTLYHLPGNADVRIHLLAAALLTGWLGAELLLVAAYYNFRWIVRYYLVLRRVQTSGKDA